MVRLNKNRKDSLANIDIEKKYSISEASTLVKENAREKFDASIIYRFDLG